MVMRWTVRALDVNVAAEIKSNLVGWQILESTTVPGRMFLKRKKRNRRERE